MRKAGALALAYAQLYSKNQLAMLTKAAEVQARVREQMQAKALSPAPAGGAMNFGFAEGETLRFG